MGRIGSGSGTRPVGRQSFWSHQLTEYVLGAVVLSNGLGGGVALVPILCGAAVVLLAATADGPFAVMKLVPRPVHRVLDVVVALGLIAAVVIAHDDIGTFGTVIALVTAAVLLALVVRTDYSPPVKRRWFGGGPPDTGPSGGSSGARPGAPDTTAVPATGDIGRSEQMGRSAGRLAGRAARRAVDRVQQRPRR